MTRLTRKEAIRLTRKAWNELAQTGGGEKPGWLHEYKNDCTICEYVHQLCRYRGVKGFNIGRNSVESNMLLCEKYCPFQWPKNDNGYSVCTGEEGLFSNWNSERNNNTKKKLAKQIANLPVKRKSRCKDSLELGFKGIK